VLPCKMSKNMFGEFERPTQAWDVTSRDASDLSIQETNQCAGADTE